MRVTGHFVVSKYYADGATQYSLVWGTLLLAGYRPNGGYSWFKPRTAWDEPDIYVDQKATREQARADYETLKGGKR